MKTEMIIVANNGKGMDTALAETDKTAELLGLTGKDALHLRLLAEEMMNMVRSIISQHVGQYWIGATDQAVQLHLKTVTAISSEQRAQLISASSKGKNEAHRGIMGKIRSFFEPMPGDETPAYFAAAIMSGGEEDLTWSMNAYREQLFRNKDMVSGAQEEWDELEKSLVSHLADEIKVSIHGVDVELVILKKLSHS